MLRNSTRRWLAGVGVAGAFVAASATPVLAAAPQAELGVYFSDTTIATDSDGKVDYSIIRSSAPVVLHDVTVRYDLTGLAGKVTLGEEEETGIDCTSPAANVLVCSSPWELELDEWGLAGIFPVQIKATGKAEDGDAGTLKVTLSATGFDGVSHEAKVRVGEGVDLAAGPEATVSAAPGKNFTAPLKVTNAGGTTAKGASVIFYNDYGLNATKHYSNCTYVGDELRTCRFDEELPAGSTFGATLPYALGTDTLAPSYKYGQTLWMTPAEFEDYTNYLGNYDVTIGKPGTDGKLTLAEATGRVAARGAQADKRPENNGMLLQVKVTGTNSTDLEALGATVSGPVGAKVKATVGLRNNGPATLDYSHAGSSVTYLAFDVPKGTTTTAVPENCSPVKGDEWGEPGQAGGRHYRCYFDSFLKAGATVTLDFGLKIDKVIANDTGLVKINVPCECDGGFYRDVKPANDTAKVVVNAAPGGGDGGQGGGDGGTLPITGSSTALIAGIGAVLLAAGGVGYVLTRRRRTRFVA
ncbi:LPXTG cell wall anchor domain-containing protein [Micromonospora sp. DT31]|uniref:LPXTG cell wall anchor domain-containing protein n=1 Tax=Micromonospora sp. DT31 TaxID=3393434 RepID=UPI003CEEECE2